MSRPGDEGGDGFLGRWSRLKRERAGEAGGAEPAEAPAEAPAPEGPPRTDAEVLEALGLPEPESLGAGDDFTRFLAKAVPEHLRRRALRRLWLTDPVLANVDGLVDYGGDFTDKATVVADLKTAWQVGRGYLRDAPEGAEGAAAEAGVAAEGDEAPGAAAAGPGDAAPPEPEDAPAARGDAGEVAGATSPPGDAGEDGAGENRAVEEGAREGAALAQAAAGAAGRGPEREAEEAAGERETRGAGAPAPVRRRMVFRVPERG